MDCDLEVMEKVSWKLRRKDRIIKGDSSCEDVCMEGAGRHVRSVLEKN